MRKSVIILLIASSLQADNEISIVQSGGTNTDLKVNQLGSNNTIKMYDAYSYINGNNFQMELYQNNDGTEENVIDLWHLDGNNNSIRWGQGGKLDDASDTTFYYDGSESGGHYANLDIHGSNNNVYVEQRGDGDKTINLTISNDGNDVQVVQKNTGHTATINLSGSDPTTLNLLQQGYTSQSYSLSQNCITVGGCSVSVTQGQ